MFLPDSTVYNIILQIGYANVQTCRVGRVTCKSDWSTIFSWWLDPYWSLHRVCSMRVICIIGVYLAIDVYQSLLMAVHLTL